MCRAGPLTEVPLRLATAVEADTTREQATGVPVGLQRDKHGKLISSAPDDEQSLTSGSLTAMVPSRGSVKPTLH